MSKYLVAPLNWGLGHASRCVSLVRRLLNEGHEVILGGDGESLTLLRRHFPKLRYVYLAPLKIRYSSGKSQVGAMLRALPKLVRWAIQDHAMLQAVLREESIDCVISDNRFRLYSNQLSAISGQPTKCIYLTHQLHIMLPKGLNWAEPIASRLHARIYAHYDEVWVPDYEENEKSLAGELSKIPSSFHLSPFNLKYIGPLSRFENHTPYIIHHTPYDVVALLSGLEPQRSMLEEEIVGRYAGKAERVLIVEGLPGKPQVRIKRANITIVPTMRDEELVPALLGAQHIIARSGYSTIMDLDALGILKKNQQKENFQFSIFNFQLELIPTPGQPEQEYLASYHAL